MQKYTKLIIEDQRTRIADKRKSEWESLSRRLAAKGQFKSGHHITEFINIGCNYIEEIVDNFLDAEKKAISNNELTEDYFVKLKDELTRLTDSEYNAVKHATIEFHQRIGLSINIDSIIANHLEERYRKIRQSAIRNVDLLQEELKMNIIKASSDKNKSDNMSTLQRHKSKDIWLAIEEDFDVSKRLFARKIAFVKDSFSREIIFRDIEQAYVLANNGFYKPAVILAGSVIEELLRQYLAYKEVKPPRNSFDSYIKTCQDSELLKDAIHRLTDSVRHFRNLVHLSKEASKKYTISKATAKSAVSSLFIVMNDFY